MDIRNVTEFRNFLRVNGLSNSHPTFQAVLSCVMDYERTCNCSSKMTKQNIYNNCKRLYGIAAGVAVTSMRTEVLSKIPDRRLRLFQDNALLASIG